MQLFAGFSQQVEQRARGAMEQVSEVDLSDANDLVAQRHRPATGGFREANRGARPASPCWCISATADFEAKFRTLLDDIGAVAGDRGTRRVGGFAVQPRGHRESGHARQLRSKLRSSVRNEWKQPPRAAHARVRRSVRDDDFAAPAFRRTRARMSRILRERRI